MSAVVTSVGMATQDRRSTDLDSPHYTPLFVGRRSSVLLEVGWTELLKDVRHLEGWPAHLGKGQAISNHRVQWAEGLTNGCGGHPSITLSRNQTLMAEKGLDRPNVRARLQKMGGETMSKKVWRHLLLEPRS